MYKMKLFNLRKLRNFTTYGNNKRNKIKKLLKKIVLKVQKPAPDFTAKLVENGQIIPTFTKTDLLKNPQNPVTSGYALLIFYPLNFTFVCPTELTAYSDRIDEFHAEGCRIVGISVDSEYSHLQWMKQPRSTGGLLSDDPIKGKKNN